MNRFYYAVIVAIITLMANGFALPTMFASSNNTAYQQAIQFVKDKGIMTGSEDGQFHPELGLTRCELVKVTILTALNHLKTTAQVQQFSDLPSNHWCTKYVNVASSEGIANGYPDGTFKPNRKVTQIEALKIIFTATGFSLGSPLQDITLPFTDVAPSDWWAPYIKYGLEKNIIPVHTGPKFGIQNEIRRDEVAFILWNILKPISTSPVYGDAITMQTISVLADHVSVIHYCSGRVVFGDYNGGLKSCIGKNTLVVTGSDNSSAVIDSMDTTHRDMGPVLFTVKSETNRQNPFVLISYVPRYFAPNYFDASSERDEHTLYKMDPTYINFFFDIVSKQSKKIENYPDGAQYFEQGELRSVGANSIDPYRYGSLAIYWSTTDHKAVFIPATCEMMAA